MGGWGGASDFSQVTAVQLMATKEAHYQEAFGQFGKTQKELKLMQKMPPVEKIDEERGITDTDVEILTQINGKPNYTGSQFYSSQASTATGHFVEVKAKKQRNKKRQRIGLNDDTIDIEDAKRLAQLTRKAKLYNE